MPNCFFRPKNYLKPNTFHLTPTKGFTLIEVMITVAIISILSGFSFSVITATQRSNRDTLRKTDLNNIQSILQQYYTDQLFYPSLGNSGLTPGNPITNCTGNPAGGCSVSRTYLNKTPGDPSGNSAYYYLKLPAGCDNTTVDNRCYNYCLYTTLENPIAGFVSPSTICSDSLPAGYNYIVTQP